MSFDYSRFFQDSGRAWLIAGLTAAIVFLVLSIVREVLIKRLGALAERTETDIDDAFVAMVKATSRFFLVAMGIAAGTRGMAIQSSFHGALPVLLKLVVLWQIGAWISALIEFLVSRSLTKRSESGDSMGVAAVKAIGITVKIVSWVLISAVALEFVFDKNPTTLLTGIGISGIALALAVQSILGDILAAVAIVFDRPFDVGDSIQVDNLSGTVEQIGLKTTRIRSVTGEQLVIGNAELLKSKLRNFRRMQERRVLLTLDITLDTPPDLVERIPAMMKEIVKSQQQVRFERSHFAAFMESSLRIETVYFILDRDYGRMMDVQQAVNLAVLRRFRAEKITFAFPTRTVSVQGLPEVPVRPAASAARAP